MINRRWFLSLLGATALSPVLPEPVFEVLNIPSIGEGPDGEPVVKYTGMLVRSQLWSKEIKEILLDELVSMKFNDI